MRAQTTHLGPFSSLLAPPFPNGWMACLRVYILVSNKKEKKKEKKKKLTMRAQTMGLFSVLLAPPFPNTMQPVVVGHNLAMQYKPQSVIKKKKNLPLSAQTMQLRHKVISAHCD